MNHTMLKCSCCNISLVCQHDELEHPTVGQGPTGQGRASNPWGLRARAPSRFHFYLRATLLHAPSASLTLGGRAGLMPKRRSVEEIEQQIGDFTQRNKEPVVWFLARHLLQAVVVHFSPEGDEQRLAATRLLRHRVLTWLNLDEVRLPVRRQHANLRWKGFVCTRVG